MALVTLTGYPCAGKSSRTAQLVAQLNTRISDSPFSNVHVVSDESLTISRSVYDSSANEKPARASLFATCQRLLSPSSIVIIDSLNYIKGFRYQLYCAARELKLRVCTIYVIATPESCKERNQHLSSDHRYSDLTLEGLINRYEEPSSMARWDSPLFTIHWDEALPIDDIWQAITQANVKPPNPGTLSADKAPTDALQILDTTATRLLTLLSSDPNFPYGGSIPLSLSSDCKVTIILPQKPPTTSQLQRLRRQFVNIHRKAITLGTTERGAIEWTEQSVANRFVEFLQEHLT